MCLFAVRKFGKKLTSIRKTKGSFYHSIIFEFCERIICTKQTADWAADGEKCICCVKAFTSSLFKLSAMKWGLHCSTLPSQFLVVLLPLVLICKLPDFVPNPIRNECRVQTEGSICICGTLAQSINESLGCDQFSLLPTTEQHKTRHCSASNKVPNSRYSWFRFKEVLTKWSIFITPLQTQFQEFERVVNIYQGCALIAMNEPPLALPYSKPSDS